jgi:hypothetical protein
MMYRFAIPVACDFEAEYVAVMLCNAHYVGDGHVGHDCSELACCFLNTCAHDLLPFAPPNPHFSPAG